MTAQRPHCLCCGVVIGVYEPVIVIEHEQARRTALAREPELVHQADTLLFAHGSCAPPDWRNGEWSTILAGVSGRARRPQSRSRSAIQTAAASVIRVNGVEPTG